VIAHRGRKNALHRPRVREDVAGGRRQPIAHPSHQGRAANHTEFRKVRSPRGGEGDRADAALALFRAGLSRHASSRRRAHGHPESWWRALLSQLEANLYAISSIPFSAIFRLPAVSTDWPRAEPERHRGYLRTVAADARAFAAASHINRLLCVAGRTVGMALAISSCCFP